MAELIFLLRVMQMVLRFCTYSSFSSWKSEIIGLFCKMREQAHQSWCLDGADYIGTGNSVYWTYIKGNIQLYVDGNRFVFLACKLRLILIRGRGCSMLIHQTLESETMKTTAVVSCLGTQSQLFYNGFITDMNVHFQVFL